MHKRRLKGGERGLERAINALFTCRPPPQFKKKGALTISLASSLQLMEPERPRRAEKLEKLGFAGSMHTDGDMNVGKICF